MFITIIANLTGTSKGSRRALGATACAIFFVVGAATVRTARGQSSFLFQARARSEFDVASIKPCSPHTVIGTNGGMVSAGTVSFTCQTLLTYIRSAYTRFAPGGPVRIQGGPPWVDKDLYQITAKAEGAASVATTAGPMMQTLLEDRFKLKTHTETEEVPAYAIVVAKKAAPKLPVAKVACFTPFAENPFPRLKQGESPPPLCGSGIFKEDGIEVRGSTMTEFCLALSKMPLRLDCRKIIDKTGVVGRFDFDLRFPPDFPELPVEQGVQAAPQTSLG